MVAEAALAAGVPTLDGTEGGGGGGEGKGQVSKGSKGELRNKDGTYIREAGTVPGQGKGVGHALLSS